jgi:pimeloyl-ACP methyl ester carboxylesterase
MAFVLIHGAAHGAWCWEPLVPYLDGSALALDLPGRGRTPGDLEKLTLDDFARSAAGEIESAGLSRVILVGHSMAGLTLPRVVEKIPERIAHVILVACLVPGEGQSISDVFSIPEEARAAHSSGDGAMDQATARFMFCNDMDEAQTRFVLERLCPEAQRPLTEPARLAGLRRPVPRSYVKLLRDQALEPPRQDEFIRNAGPGCAVHELDAGHDAMISRPRELASILNRIARSTR